MAKKEKPYACGTMTPARFHSFKMGMFRDALRRWKPRQQCIKDSFAEYGINPDTGRKVKMHRCSACNNLFRQMDMRADHVEPMVPTTGFVSWDETMDRAFVEVDGFQAVCVSCHQKVSNEENSKRRVLDGVLKKH